MYKIKVISIYRELLKSKRRKYTDGTLIHKSGQKELERKRCRDKERVRERELTRTVSSLNQLRTELGS